MRKALRHPSVRTGRGPACAALALGLLLGGCVRPYDGYYVPSYSSSPGETSKEEERKEYSEKKSRYNHHGWRGVSPSGYRNDHSGSHHRNGNDHGGKRWRNR